MEENEELEEMIESQTPKNKSRGIDFMTEYRLLLPENGKGDTYAK